MKEYAVQFALSYEGAEADTGAIDFYDIAQALIGFERSLALTTHLVLNGEIITQAPSLKGASIFARPPEEGSWKINAGILIAGTAAYHIATAPNNTPLGHLVYSAYDYVISESLGFHVDYNKSLGQLYEEYKEKQIELPKISESQLDSVIEKCTTALTEMHRPIYKNKTALEAHVTARVGAEPMPLSPTFSIDSFQYIIEEYESSESESICGFVSSYNANTFKGRIYVPGEGRPIAFVLTESARDEGSIKLIVESLSANALRGYESNQVEICCRVRPVTTKTGHLKKYKILEVFRG